jgi:hypothetical protein
MTLHEASTSPKCAMLHRRGPARVKALRPVRGAQSTALTQALAPARFLRHVGNVQVWLSAMTKFAATA